MVNNLLTNHIKRMSIKKGKNDNTELPKFDDINLNNMKMKKEKKKKKTIKKMLKIKNKLINKKNY